MNRREALSRVALLLGGTIVGSEAFLAGCSTDTGKGKFKGILTADQVAFLDEVGETILPATPGSGGAKFVQIGDFMNSIVTDCYEPKQQVLFTDGIVKLQELSKSVYKQEFMDLTAGERTKLLTDVDAAASAYTKKKKLTDPNHYFTLFKQLTLWGYFSSKEGATKALRYVAVPGRYEGDIPYKKGDKAWAT